MAQRIRRSRARQDLVCAGVSWMEADKAWPWRVAGAVVLFLMGTCIWLMEQPHRVFGSWAMVWSWLLVAVCCGLAFSLLYHCAQQWANGGRERQLLFLREGPTSTPFGLSWFPRDGWRRFFKINADHDVINGIRVRPAMTLAWGGRPTGHFDVVVDYKDRDILDLAIGLPASEAKSIAAMATEALADIRAAGSRSDRARFKQPQLRRPNPDWDWFWEWFPASRPVVEHDQSEAIIIRGVQWWEGTVLRGAAMTALHWGLLLPGIGIPYLIAKWNEHPVLYCIGLAMAAAGIVLALLMPEFGLRGIKRSLQFSGNGSMKVPYGMAMYPKIDAIAGHHNEIADIVARRMVERWGVMLFKRDGGKIYLAIDMTELDARELAGALNEALGELRRDAHGNCATGAA